MLDARQLARQVRQMLRTDALLGADRVPLGQFDPAQDAGVADRPARDADAGSTPGPAAAPDDASPAAPAAASPTGYNDRSPRTPAPTGPSSAESPAPAPPPPDEMSGHEMTREGKADALAELERRLTAWVEAEWPRDGWQRVVFGEGDPDARLMFIGEGPGAEEDAKGRPFVGRAGQLLDKQIDAMQLQRGQVYIANIAKARPPGNRVPTPDEAEHWLPWLNEQIGIITPEVIVTLGATSAKYLLGEPRFAITKERGKWRSYRGIALMPTFHPAYLLRQYSVENRRRVWSDLQAAMERLGLTPPK